MTDTFDAGACRETTIPASMKRLEGAFEHLQRRLEEVTSRLDPVMSPPPELKASGAVGTGPTTTNESAYINVQMGRAGAPLADQIDSLSRGVEAASGAVQELLQRLEV